MELTGTNGPTAYTITPLTGWSRVDYTIPGSHAPSAAATGRVSDRLDGGHSGGETPGPIPNPVAKPASADGTAPARVWESRTPPSPTLRVGTRRHAPAHHTNRYDPTYQAARRKRGGSPDSVRPNHIKQQPDKAIYPPLASADCANRYEVRTRTPLYYAALARAQRRIAGVLHFPGIPKIAFWVCRLRPRPCKSARSPTSK